MALFGKKKKAEPTAPSVENQDEIPVVGDDAGEIVGAEIDEVEDGGGQSIDFDAIADELGDDDGESALGEPLGDMDASAAATAPGDMGADFGSTSDFNSGNAGLDADDELDFNSVFDEGAPVPVATAATATAATATATAATVQTDENPFGADLDGEASFGDTSAGDINIEPVSDTPPLTYTAPLLTSDAVAKSGVPATRKSLPLPMILGALGLLIALGAVGYLVTQGKDSTSEETLVTTANPPLRATKVNAESVAMAASVDGVPIAAGAMVAAPALRAPQTTVPPAVMAQLKTLWSKGAAAKKRDDFAGARAAWSEMLRVRPNHPGVQEAINKLP